MLGLLRAIAGALKNALLAALEFGWWAVTLPLRMLAPPAGESAIPGPDRAMHGELQNERETANDLLEATKRNESTGVLGDMLQAATVSRWTAGGGNGTPPENLAMGTRAWLQNLSPVERAELGKVGYKRVFEHMCGRERIPGVPTPKDLAGRHPPGLTIRPIRLPVDILRPVAAESPDLPALSPLPSATW